MTWWCTHKFHELQRVFSGRAKIDHVEGCSEQFAKTMTFGVTTIISKCGVCGRLTTTEVLGDATR